MSLPAEYYIDDNGGSPMMQPKLSILIPSIPERKEQLEYLLNKLRPISFVRDYCEIIVDDSKRHDEGGLSVGYKRQALLDKAKGEYIWFLDDDDDFNENMFNDLKMHMDAYKWDVICAKTLAILNGTPHVIDTSIDYDNEQIHDGETKRFPSVMNIYKREVALRVKFNDKNYGEDFEWSMALGLQTEVKINDVWHIYNFDSVKTVASK